MALFTKYATQRNERTIRARLVAASLTTAQTSTSDGIPEGYTQLSAALTATGVFVITFLKPFLRTPIVAPTALHSTQKNFCTIAAVSTSACTVNVWNDTGSAASPTGLHVDITGFDAADQI